LWVIILKTTYGKGMKCFLKFTYHLLILNLLFIDLDLSFDNKKCMDVFQYVKISFPQQLILLITKILLKNKVTKPLIKIAKEHRVFND